MTNTEAMHQHILSAYHFAKQAHERCYYDTDTQTPADKTAALALTAHSVSHYAAAAALYLSNRDDEDTATSTKPTRITKACTKQLKTHH